MPRMLISDRLSVRAEAERFLATHGFSTPPLPPDEALAARNLEVAQLSLDDLLVKANLPSEDHKSIQAMLNPRERMVVFRSGLPSQKRNWGSLHEVAHEFLPWQREILYCCPLLSLPAKVQKQLEVEADVFAAEAFFFGQQFHKQAFAGDLGLTSAIELATSVYCTSLHSTFVHYVKESPLSRCLLVWKPGCKDGFPPLVGELVLHYYVKSKDFHGHVDPGQVADPDEVVTKMFTDSIVGVIKHELILADGSGQRYVAQAESFSNSYNVFTLISQPTRKSVQPVASPQMS
jgi:hypothetical protein